MGEKSLLLMITLLALLGGGPLQGRSCAPDSIAVWWRAGADADAAGDFPAATTLLIQALDCATLHADTLMMVRSLNSLGIVQTHLRRYEQARQYLYQALALKPQRRDSLVWSNCLNSLGNVWSLQGATDSARVYYEHARRIKVVIGDMEALPVVLMNLAGIGWSSGELDLALAYDLEAVALHQQTGNQAGEAEARNNVAYVYREMNRLPEARTFALAGLDLARQVRNRNIQLSCLINLSTISARLGDHAAGFDYQRQYIYLKDSLYNEENQRLISEMEARFDSERKERDLALQAETIARQEAGLRLRGLVIAGVLLLMLLTVGAMLYAFQRRRWRLEQERREAQRLKELDAFKSRFFTHITHEFRTPLTVILGLAGEHAQEPDWDMTQRNARHLLQLINQLLDLAKLEAGQLPLQWAQADAVALLRYLCESFRSLASQRDIALDFAPATGTLPLVLDPEKVQAIFANLLGNALKFTPEGGAVQVRVAAGAGQWSFAVADNGPGIAPEAQARIFDRFAQANPQDAGTGIGLALARELATLMGGTLAVESVPGAGSTFTCRLPIPQVEAPAMLPAPLPVPAALPAARPQAALLSGERPHLLIIEDQADVAEYLRRCLEDQYDISLAVNGAQGIDLALEQVPDAIVSDVMMPEKDGFEVCQTLKQDARTSHIPIVLLTARAAIADKLQGLRHGADAYLPKPFDREELLVRLEQLILLRRKLQARYQSLAALPAPATETEAVEDTFIQRVRAQVLAHLQEEDFSVEKLADLLHLSRTQLFRKVKALTGRSVSQFVNQVRIGEAQRLLRETDLTVSEVAYQAGFADPGYFMRVFAREVGMSAGAWREKPS